MSLLGKKSTDLSVYISILIFIDKEEHTEEQGSKNLLPLRNL